MIAPVINSESSIIPPVHLGELELALHSALCRHGPHGLYLADLTSSVGTYLRRSFSFPKVALIGSRINLLSTWAIQLLTVLWFRSAGRKNGFVWPRTCE
jgi:hypothetical protein